MKTQTDEFVRWLLTKSHEHSLLTKLHTEKAKKYAEMAETINSDCSEGVISTTTIALGAVNAECVRAYLMERNARPADLAKHFNVLPSAIRAITEDPANGIISVDRGWLKLK